MNTFVKKWCCPEAGIVSNLPSYICFESKNYRLTSAEDILKYWNTIGIENGEMVLQDLGLYIEDESDAENIDVNELTRVLQVS